MRKILAQLALATPTARLGHLVFLSVSIVLTGAGFSLAHWSGSKRQRPKYEPRGWQAFYPINRCPDADHKEATLWRSRQS
jgi:hypothetical protein